MSTKVKDVPLKAGGFEWVASAKDTWVAQTGDTVPTRIKELDAKTFAVYRAGRYLGCEASFKDAAERAKTNARSEINREMAWQQKHPDEQPLGLRLTPEERAKGWQDAPPKAARAAAKPVPPVAGGRMSGGTVPSAKATREAATSRPVRVKADAGSKDAEIAALLKRGCTSQEVLRVTGWTAISMPAMAKKLGLGLRIDKGVKPFKYYGEEKK